MAFENAIDVVLSMTEEAIDKGFIVTLTLTDENESLVIKTKEEIANILLFINDFTYYTIFFEKGEEEYCAAIYDDLFGTLEGIFESHSDELPNILPNTFRLIDNI